MELVTEPDTYTPSIDIDGNYIDVVPSINILKRAFIAIVVVKVTNYTTHILVFLHT